MGHQTSLAASANMLLNAPHFLPEKTGGNGTSSFQLLALDCSQSGCPDRLGRWTGIGCG